MLMAAALSGCSSWLPERIVDSVSSFSRSEAVGIDSEEPISDFWLRKYNIAAQSELARVWRYGQHAGWSRRYEKILKAVLKYDKNNADYFATEVNDERDRMGRDVEFAKLTKIFRNHGVILNWRYSDYRNGDFLWKLGDNYVLDDDISQLLRSIYPEERFDIPILETVTTESRSANLQIADLAFLAPASLTKLSERLGWNAEDAIRTVAAHEAAHHINEQLVSGLGYTLKPYYRTNLDQISDLIDEIDFYHETEVEEFLADAVAIQTSQLANHPDQVIGFIASRILQDKDAFELVSHNYGKRRRRAHFASAEFIFRLFEKEEIERGSDRPAISIASLKQQGKTGTSWKKENWLPYLDQMLTDEFIAEVRQSYLDAFFTIRASLRM